MAPTRRPGTPPVVTVEVSPAYELLQSIPVTMEGKGGDTYDVGDEWIVRAVNVAPLDLLHTSSRLTTMEGYWEEYMGQSRSGREADVFRDSRDRDPR